MAQPEVGTIIYKETIDNGSPIDIQGGDDDFLEEGKLRWDRRYFNIPKDLSLVNRKGYYHCKNDGAPMLYDLAVTISSRTQPHTATWGEFIFAAAPCSWTVRNSLVMAQKIRLEQLKNLGKSLKSLSPYNRALTVWLDDAHTGDEQPVYIDNELAANNGSGYHGYEFTNNYKTLTGDEYERTTLISADDATGFDLAIMGTHTGTYPNWTQVSLTRAYHEARAAIPESLPAGESSDAIVTDSPFMSLKKLESTVDGMTDEILENLKEERDEQPYDTVMDGDHTNLTIVSVNSIKEGSGWTTTARFLAPTGQFKLYSQVGKNVDLTSDHMKADPTECFIQVKVLGIHEM